MIWARDGWVIEIYDERSKFLSPEEAKKQYPEWYFDRPQLAWGLHFFVQAFEELSTDRIIGFGGFGPIPMSAIRSYARDHGLNADLFEDLKYHIAAMDAEWLKENNKRGKPNDGLPGSNRHRQSRRERGDR